MADIRVQQQAGTPAAATPAESEAPPSRAPVTEPSIADLFRQLAQDSTTLIRQEVALAKLEMRENVRGAARDVSMLAVGAGIAAIGGLVFTAFLVLILGEALANYWLAALIVGAVYLLIGGVMAWSNLRSLRTSELKPGQTIDSLKEDREWIQQEIREARRERT